MAESLSDQRTPTYDDLTLWALLEQIKAALDDGDEAKARATLDEMFGALAGR